MNARIICCMLALFCADVFAQQPNRRLRELSERARALPEGTKAIRNIAYVPNGHDRQKLDLFIPKGATNPLPLIIWVHGGGWRAGSKENCPALRLLGQGYAVASINYRLSQDAIFPAQIEDCKAAVRWLRAHAKENGIDPNRFAAWGSSAGGHLVALLGTSGDVKAFDVGDNIDVSSRVQAVVDFFGPIDFTLMKKYSLPNAPFDHDAADSPESKLIGGAVQENKDKVAIANPMTYITKDDPAFLIMHGNRDNIVPYEQSEMFRDALKKADVPVTLKILEGAGHGFGGRIPHEDVLEFLNKNLRGNPKKT